MKIPWADDVLEYCVHKQEMNLKPIVKQLIPPFMSAAWSRLRSNSNPPEWEYLPEGWPSIGSQIKGWNVESVAAVQKARWAQLLSSTESKGLPGDPTVQHTLLAYAYVLTLTARMKERVSLLDWGGGLGQYYLWGQALVPGVKIDYSCLETPVLCRAGRELLPDAAFFEEEAECLQRKYDLVLVSSALQYFKNWQHVAKQLASAFKTYLYVTRLPIVQHSPSFVVLQRPYQYGYQTEYPNWFLNRQEFLDFMSVSGAELVREFQLSEKPVVRDAPEQCEYRGYLFGMKSISL